MPLFSLDCLAGTSEWFDRVDQVEVDGIMQPVLAAVLAAGEMASNARRADAAGLMPLLDKEYIRSVEHESGRLITDAIRSIEPNASIVSKATPVPSLTATGSWYVDPLDGTRFYVNGSPEWSILLHRTSTNSAAFSVAYFPDAGILAVADSAELLVVEAAVSSKVVNLEGPARIDSAYFDFTANQSDNYARDRFKGARLMIELAAGRTDAVITRMCGQRSWDVAPVLHIAMAGGATVTDENGRSISFSGANCSAKEYIIAARSAYVHTQVSRQLDAMLQAEAQASTPS